MILCFEAEGAKNENTPSVGFSTSCRVSVKASIPVIPNKWWGQTEKECCNDNPELGLWGHSTDSAVKLDTFVTVNFSMTENEKLSANCRL